MAVNPKPPAVSASNRLEFQWVFHQHIWMLAGRTLFTAVLVLEKKVFDKF